MPGPMSDPMLADLCAQRYARLVGLAAMLAGNRADAEDLVHESLVAVFSRKRSFPSLNASEAYVRRTIATRFIDTKRKAGRERQANARIAARIEPVVLASELVDPRLDAALAALPPRVRVCVVLRFVDDMSIAETASALGLATGTVKRYVADGLAQLNAALGTSEVADDVNRVDVSTGEERR